MRIGKKATGYILGAIAAISYGMNPLFTLPLYSAGMNPDSVLFFRYLFAIPIVGAMLKLRGRSFKIDRGQGVSLFVFGMLCAVSSLTLFLSYQYMDAGIASTLLFVYPIMVALIMAFFFREKLTFATLICLAMAVSGIALLYKGDGGSTLSLTGTLFVIVSALCYAVYIVGVNRGRLKEVATLKILFYVLLFGWLLFAFRAIFGGGIQLPPADKWWLWGNLFALGLLPTAVSFFCTTQAIQYIGSTPTAILGALEPVTAVVFGITVFGESMTAREFTGLVLIILAVGIVVASGSISTYFLRIRKMFPRLTKKKTQSPKLRK